MTNELKDKYKKEVVPALVKTYNYTSVMQVPKIEKITLNMGVGDATQDPKLLDLACKEIELIAGQKPVRTKAKKSIATFKLREGQQIGCKVTLRGDKMWSFLSRLINIALPRVRDFRGLPNRSFDHHGNYTIGIQEQIIFPEINYDDVKKIRGFDINIITSTDDDKQARSLLKLIGLPLVRVKGEN